MVKKNDYPLYNYITIVAEVYVGRRGTQLINTKHGIEEFLMVQPVVIVIQYKKFWCASSQKLLEISGLKSNSYKNREYRSIRMSPTLL